MMFSSFFRIYNTFIYNRLLDTKPYCEELTLIKVFETKVHAVPDQL